CASRLAAGTTLASGRSGSRLPTRAGVGRLKTREAARVGHPSAEARVTIARASRRMVDAGAEGRLEPTEHAPP
ncbi:MAG: hypothetical protein ACK5U8_25315, partial [Deltaproteobacteria bacterium]